MQGNVEEVLSQALSWLESGRRAALGTVLSTFGGSPRPPGAMETSPVEWMVPSTIPSTRKLRVFVWISPLNITSLPSREWIAGADSGLDLVRKTAMGHSFNQDFLARTLSHWRWSRR